jgi:SagB-type dehydrogenase family enzyme
VIGVWSRSQRFTLNLTLFNRLPLHPQVNDIVGDFTSIVLLSVDNTEPASFLTRALRLKEQLWQDLDHRFMSGVEVLRELARMRKRITGLPTPVVLTSALMSGEGGQDDTPLATLGEMGYSVSQTPQVWLDHQVYEQAGALVFNWDAVEDLFPRGLLDDMLSSYCRLLRDLAEDERAWHATEFDLLPAEQAARRRAVNAAAAPPDGPLCELAEAETAAKSQVETAAAEGLVAEVAQIFAEVLELEQLDPDADLMALGVNSLHMVRIANALEVRYGFRPQIEEMFGVVNVRGLVDRFEQTWRPNGSAQPGREADGTSMTPPGRPGLLLDAQARADFKRRQPGLRRDVVNYERISLPEALDAEELRRRYARRRSHRRFNPNPIELTEFSRFIGCLRQLSSDGEPKFGYPSAGGLYPVQVYLHVKPERVEGLGAGVYYYQPVTHELIRLNDADEIGRDIHEPFVNRPLFDEAAFSVFLVARLAAVTPLYGELGLRFATLEAGYIGQLLMTAETDARIGLCPIGSLDFEKIRHLFALDASDVLVHSLLGGGVASADGEARPSLPPEAFYDPATGEGETEEGEI